MPRYQLTVEVNEKTLRDSYDHDSDCLSTEDLIEESMRWNREEGITFVSVSELDDPATDVPHDANLELINSLIDKAIDTALEALGYDPEDEAIDDQLIQDLLNSYPENISVADFDSILRSFVSHTLSVDTADTSSTIAAAPNSDSADDDEDQYLTWKLTFEVDTPSGTFRLYRFFETESEEQAREEALEIAQSLSFRINSRHYSNATLEKVEEVKAVI